jgi:hypothetical protein
LIACNRLQSDHTRVRVPPGAYFLKMVELDYSELETIEQEKDYLCCPYRKISDLGDRLEVICYHVGLNDKPTLTTQRYDAETNILHVNVSYYGRYGSGIHLEMIDLPGGTRVVKFHPTDWE